MMGMNSKSIWCACCFAYSLMIQAFSQKTISDNYIEQSKSDGSDPSHRIADLFEVLNMPDDIRAKLTMLSEELRRFRYINGNLFALRLTSADFNKKM